MDANLLQIRLKSFGWSLISFLGLAFCTALLSDGFRSLIVEHFGNSLTASLILLIVPELVKGFRNAILVKKLGSSVSGDSLSEKVDVILI